MNARGRYRNPYRRSMKGWWLRKPAFRRYMAREAASVFLLCFALILLCGVVALSRGEAAYAAWLAFLGHPLVVAWHVIALAAALYHSYTWFGVSPKAAPPLYLGGRRLPDAALIGGQYVALAVLSALVLLLVGHGAGGDAP